MHLEECTFHGIIVERDNLGKELYPAPTNQPSMQPPVKISKKRKEVSSTSIQRLSKTLSKKSAIQSVNRANDTEASLKLRERKIHKW